MPNLAASVQSAYFSEYFHANDVPFKLPLPPEATELGAIKETTARLCPD